NSINGADGLLIDDADNFWVAANQSDEIVVLDSSGLVIAKLGDFGGIDAHGSPIGLLFPASVVISNGFVYVTNLALDLRLFEVAVEVRAAQEVQELPEVREAQAAYAAIRLVSRCSSSSRRSGAGPRFRCR